MNEVRVVGSIDKVQSNLDFYLSVSSIDRKLSIEQYKKNLFEKHFEDAKLHLNEDIDELKAQIIEKTKELEERKKQEAENKLRIDEERERVRQEREERRKRALEERRKREELLEKERESSVESREPLESSKDEVGNSEHTGTDSKSESVNPILGGSIWDEMIDEEVGNTTSEEEPVKDRELVSTGRSFIDSVRNKEIKDDKDSSTEENTKVQSDSDIKEVSEQGNSGKQKEKEECEYVKNGLFLEELILEEPDENTELGDAEEVQDEVESEDTKEQEVEDTNEEVSKRVFEEKEYVEHGNFLEDLIQDESDEEDTFNEESNEDLVDSEDTDVWNNFSEEYDEEDNVELPNIDDEEEIDEDPQGTFEDSEEVGPDGLFEDEEESETVDISEKKHESKIIPMVKKEVSMEDDGMYAQNLPRDVRDFLKLHPNSDMSYVLKFYSKKEIDKQIRLGKIFTRKGKLMI